MPEKAAWAIVEVGRGHGRSGLRGDDGGLHGARQPFSSRFALVRAPCAASSTAGASPCMGLQVVDQADAERRQLGRAQRRHLLKGRPFDRDLADVGDELHGEGVGRDPAVDLQHA